MKRVIAIVLCATGVAEAQPDRRTKLNKEVEDFDWQGSHPRAEKKIPRERGFFVGAHLAFAPSGKLEVDNDRMSGVVDFPTVFGGQLHVGYRFMPHFSVALVPQMLFNLKPEDEDAARELEVFVQGTGHLRVAPQWDVDAFLAPGYSVLFVPDADDARGLALRYGGGPVFHLSEQLSFAAELSHQVGFQRTERNSDDVKMETSFVSILVGARLRL